MNCLSPVADLNTFFFVFLRLILMHLGMAFLGFILFEDHCASWTYVYMSFGKFGNNFIAQSYFSYPGIPVTQILDLAVVPWVLQNCLFSLCSFYSPYWVISVLLSSRSLVLVFCFLYSTIELIHWVFYFGFCIVLKCSFCSSIFSLFCWIYF